MIHYQYIIFSANFISYRQSKTPSIVSINGFISHILRLVLYKTVCSPINEFRSGAVSDFIDLFYTNPKYTRDTLIVLDSRILKWYIKCHIWCQFSVRNNQDFWIVTMNNRYLCNVNEWKMETIWLEKNWIWCFCLFSGMFQQLQEVLKKNNESENKHNCETGYE